MPDFAHLSPGSTVDVIVSAKTTLRNIQIIRLSGDLVVGGSGKEDKTSRFVTLLVNDKKQADVIQDALANGTFKMALSN